MFIELTTAGRYPKRELVNLNRVALIRPDRNSKGEEITNIDGRLYRITYTKLIKKLLRNENPLEKTNQP